MYILFIRVVISVQWWPTWITHHPLLRTLGVRGRYHKAMKMHRPQFVSSGRNHNRACTVSSELWWNASLIEARDREERLPVDARLYERHCSTNWHRASFDAHYSSHKVWLVGSNLPLFQWVVNWSTIFLKLTLIVRANHKVGPLGSLNQWDPEITWFNCGLKIPILSRPLLRVTFMQLSNPGACINYIILI